MQTQKLHQPPGRQVLPRLNCQSNQQLHAQKSHAIECCSHHVSHSFHKLYIFHLHCKSKSCCKEEEGPERTEAELYHQPGDDMELFYRVHQVHYLNKKTIISVYTERFGDVYQCDSDINREV